MSKMTMARKIQKEKVHNILRPIIYILVGLIFYVVMSTAHFPIITPVLLCSFSVAISVYETENPFYPAIFGCIFGLFTDSAFGTLIGFHSIIYMFMSLFISLFTKFYFRKNLLTFIFSDLIFSAISGIFRYIFYYRIWGYDPYGYIFTNTFLKEFIATNIWGIIIYFIVKLINHFLGKVNDKYIETNAGV